MVARFIKLEEIWWESIKNVKTKYAYVTNTYSLFCIK